MKCRFIVLQHICCVHEHFNFYLHEIKWLNGVRKTHYLIERVITDPMDVSLSELRELVMDREARRAAILGVTELDTPERLN